MATAGNALLDSSTGKVLASQIPTPDTTQSATTLLSSTSVNLKTVAATTLYTVPTGKTAVIQNFVIRITALDTYSARFVASAGGNATDYNDRGDVSDELIMVLTAVGKLKQWVKDQTVGIVYPESTNFSINVTTGATATTLTAQVEVFGYLF